jgi:hypothetical protein
MDSRRGLQEKLYNLFGVVCQIRFWSNQGGTSRNHSSAAGLGLDYDAKQWPSQFGADVSRPLKPLLQRVMNHV